MLKSKRPNRIIFFILASLIVHIALVIAVSLYHRKKTLEMEKEQQKPMTLFVEQIEEPEPPGPVPPEKQESPAQPEPPPGKPAAPAEQPPQEPPAQKPQPQKTPAPAEPEPDRKLPEQRSPVQERPSLADRSREPDATGEPGSGAGTSGSAAGSGRGGGEGAGSSGTGSGPSMEERFADLLARIERYKSGSYPLSARKLGLEGTVVVRLTLDASGVLTSLSIVEECPHRSLNEAAAELVRRVLREPFPHGLESAVRLTIPIVFKLD